RELKKRFPLSNENALLELESNTPTMAALGDLLRRTRRLYSYDHYSNVLREAAICGCEVIVIDNEGRWHDPVTCDCAYNINWRTDFRKNYAAEFHDRAFVADFIGELRTRWKIPEPTTSRQRQRIRSRLGNLGWKLKRPGELLRKFIHR